jgi:cytochrome b561
MSAYQEGRTPGARYSNVSIAFHWITALLLAIQLPLGFAMESLADAQRGAVVQVHKSMGLTILLLSLARLGWRLAHPWPPMSQTVKHWEALLARATHVAFYVALLAAPLIGWAMSSASPRGGNLYFWGLPWFKLPVPRDGDLAGALSSAHSAVAWIVIATVALHIAGALKHHFHDRNETLWRMAPLFGKPGTPAAEDPAADPTRK